MRPLDIHPDAQTAERFSNGARSMCTARKLGYRALESHLDEVSGCDKFGERRVHAANSDSS